MGLLPGRPAGSRPPRLRYDRHGPAGRTSRIHRNPRTTVASTEREKRGAEPLKPKLSPQRASARQSVETTFRAREEASPQSRLLLRAQPPHITVTAVHTRLQKTLLKSHPGR